MNSLQTNQNQTTLAKLDSSKPLTSCSINEVCQAITILNSVRNNNSTPEQLLTASAMIQNEYPNLKLGELQKIIIDGIMQKFNNSGQPQYNDVPALMFWLRRHKIDKMQAYL